MVIVVNTFQTVYSTDMDERHGIVLQGINNIYRIKCDDQKVFQCRIKGKVLTGAENEYNPLAPGDSVVIQVHHEHEGMVTGRLERRNSFRRWNLKRESVQTIAANIDRLFCITSTAYPEFRPRFIDRVAVCADAIPVTIVLNKTDLGIPEELQQQLDIYRRIGFEVLEVSARDDELAELYAAVRGRVSAFFGQSGVGKSTLINRLIPHADQNVGAVSTKYNRGRHTTNYARWIDHGDFSIIDTPGVREIEIPLMDPAEIGGSFPEFARFEDGCRFSPCLHDEEPGCAVRAAVEEGDISPERYESYLKILYTMIERKKRRYQEFGE